MEKKFKYYLAVWVLLLAVFNVIAFVSVGWISFEKYTAAFWLGYGFITLSFVLNLVYGLIAFRKADATTTFYNIAYFRIGYAELILSFVVGGMFMLIPGFAFFLAGFVYRLTQVKCPFCGQKLLDFQKAPDACPSCRESAFKAKENEA